ncbi:hypothetical protein [Nonomuraea recticatena]|uniref:hypothetical protein n=1 Tax=Nonomuraea recticatena TaxID=46178 RepID=UPI0031F8035A
MIARPVSARQPSITGQHLQVDPLLARVPEQLLPDPLRPPFSVRDVLDVGTDEQHVFRLCIQPGGAW